MFETWIASDLKDSLAARRARVLNALALWLLLCLAGLVAVALVAGGETGTFVDARLGYVAGGIAASLILTYVLSRQGALHAAVAVFETVLNIMLLVLLGALGSAGPVLVFVSFAVLATAILWSPGASAWLALVWSVIYLVVALAELGGFEPPLSQARRAFPVALSISFVIAGFGLSGVLAWLWAANAPGDPMVQPEGVESQPVREAPQPTPRDQMDQPGEGRAESRALPVEPPELPPALPASIPVVDLFHGTVVLPVVGELDAKLGAQLLSDLLQGIVEHDAQLVLLDVSHVPIIHETAAHSLARAVAGAGLMGAEVALVGIGPRLAARLVQLDVNLRGATAHVDMEAALRYALYRLGRISRPLLAPGASIDPLARQLQSGNAES
jgi:anti-anti-sigma regulatory factor